MRPAAPTLAALASSVSLVAVPAAAQTAPEEASSETAWELQDPQSADVEIVGHVLEPEQLEPSGERLARLDLPHGFETTLQVTSSAFDHGQPIPPSRRTSRRHWRGPQAPRPPAAT